MVTLVRSPTVRPEPRICSCGPPGWPKLTELFGPRVTVSPLTLTPTTGLAPDLGATTVAEEPPAWTPVSWSAAEPVLATAPITSASPLDGSTITQTLFTLRLPMTPDPALYLTFSEAAVNPAPHAEARGTTAARTAATARPARPRRDGVDRRVVLGEWRLLTVGVAP